MKMKIKLIIIFFILALTACSPKNAFDAKQNTKSELKEIPKGKSTQDQKQAQQSQPEDVNLKAESKISSIDLSKKPNELGKIMVLMYHNIGEPEDEWVRTPDNFRKDLETLYQKGYVPIRLKDYVSGNITTPIGKTPYVLTFDDVNENNFRYLEDGSIDPKCAVGILMSFADAHKDIKPYCTFFANGEVPFRASGTEKEKIKFLLEHDMDLGNHTVNHPNLNQMKYDDVLYEVGHQAKYLTSLVPDGYTIDTLALPFGSRPENENDEKAVFEGEVEGFKYKNLAVLNVGWDPYFSPYSTDFKPGYIHRVRASEMKVENVGIYDWLSYFDQNPGERFISDGQKDVITIPYENQANLIQTDKEILTY